MRTLLALIVGASLVLPAASQGASAVSPADGAMVPSRPVFQFDILYGKAEVEWARSPDVNSAGSSIGAFVDPGGDLFDLLYTHSPLDGMSTPTKRLDSGRWFWHAKLRDDGGPDGYGVEQPWGPVRTMIVRTEPPIFEGWTLAAQRLARRGACSPVRLTGRYRASDNEARPGMRLALTLRRGARTVALSSGALEPVYASARFSRIVCTRSAVTSVSGVVVDASGSRSVRSTRPVQIAAERRTPRRPGGRRGVGVP